MLALDDTAVQRRAHEGAQRATRPSDCNGGLGRRRCGPLAGGVAADLQQISIGIAKVHRHDRTACPCTGHWPIDHLNAASAQVLENRGGRCRGDEAEIRRPRGWNSRLRLELTTCFVQIDLLGTERKGAAVSATAKLTAAMVEGTPVVALCGKVWVPSRDPKRYPVCPECKEIWSHMKPGDDGGDGDQ